MGEVFLYGNGEQNPLNFRVIGSLVQPAAPKENTIWVNTDTTITSWVFAPEAPTNPEGGMIFFKTDKTSPVGFNALRKNEIAVLPTSAQQYIGGKWANKEAYAYIGGKWVQFSWTRVYLYNRGDSCNAITGNWKSAATGTSGWGNGSVDNQGGTLNVSAWDVRVACAATNNRIDLSRYKTLTFVVSSASGMENGWHRGVLLTSNTFNWNPDSGGVYGPGAVSHAINITGPGTFNIDISGENGALYVGVAMAYKSAVSISEIYLS